MSEVERIATFRTIIFPYNILMAALYLCQKENVPLITLSSKVYFIYFIGKTKDTRCQLVFQPIVLKITECKGIISILQNAAWIS